MPVQATVATVAEQAGAGAVFLPQDRPFQGHEFLAGKEKIGSLRQFWRKPECRGAEGNEED